MTPALWTTASNGPHGVGLLDQAMDLVEVGEVADDCLGTAVDKVLDGGQPGRGAGVHDDLVALLEERLAGVAADTVGGAGDQDACHDRFLSRSVRWVAGRLGCCRARSSG
jgi:hypothetical protein